METNQENQAATKKKENPTTKLLQEEADNFMSFWSNTYAEERPPQLEKSVHPASKPPSKKMIKGIIRELAKDKAPGPDNLCAEVLQAGGKAAAAMTHQLIKHIWETKTVPEELGRATIVLLPKDAKNTKHTEL